MPSPQHQPAHGADMMLAVAAAVVQTVVTAMWSAYAWQLSLLSRADAQLPSAAINELLPPTPAVVLGCAATALAAGIGALLACTCHARQRSTRIALALVCTTLPALGALALAQGENTMVALIFRDSWLWRSLAASVVGLSVGGWWHLGAAPGLPLVVVGTGAGLGLSASAFTRVLWTVDQAAEIPVFVQAVGGAQQALLALALLMVLCAARQRPSSAASGFPWAASLLSLVALGWVVRLFPFVADAALPLPPAAREAVPLGGWPPLSAALDGEDLGTATAPPANAHLVVWDGDQLIDEGVLIARTAPEAEATGISMVALEPLTARLLDADARRAAIGQPTPTPLVLVTPIDAPASARDELVRAARQHGPGGRALGNGRRVLRGCLLRQTLSTRTHGEVPFISLQVCGDFDPDAPDAR